jgi:D-alanyl-D-alanine carboxypeptidase
MRLTLARKQQAPRRSGPVAAAMVLAVAGALAGCGAPGTARLTAATASHDSRAAALTASIRRVMRQASIPGALVGVWQRGEHPYVKAFGVRNLTTRRPMSPDLHMRIGSETKTFTITALLQLVDRKKVRLDAPVSRYLRGVPDGNHITLRELAEMRSGLFSYTNDFGWARAFLSDPKRPWQPWQLLRYGFRHPPLFPPGSQFNYSNTNTILLGLVIEKAAHQSLAAFIRRNILRPEHLTQTFFPAGARLPFPRARGYTRQTLDGNLINATRWNPSWGWAAGAMNSTLRDLHAWARAVATGSLLTAATQRQREQFLPTGIPGVKAGYGLGLLNDNGWIGHNGSLPGYQSLTIYLPSQRATLVVLVNSDIAYRGNELTTLLGEAITKIITPRHVYYLPPSPVSEGGSPGTRGGAGRALRT